MSSIQKQSVLRSAISYMGMLLGAFSTIFIYPLEIESYGLSQFIYSAAEFMIPMLGLGIPFLNIRYFPYFQDEASGHRGFLGILLLGVSISSIFSLSIIWLFRSQLLNFLSWIGFDVVLFSTNALFIFCLGVLTMLTGLIETYLINFNRVLVASITNNILPKIGLPLLITGIYFGYNSELALKLGIILIPTLSLLLLLLHLKKLNLLRLRIDWSFLRTMPLKEMTTLVFISLISGVGYLLAFRIGSIMVPSLISTEQNGVYSIGNFIAMAIEVPFISLAAIIAPFFASHASRQEWREIAKLYHKYSQQILIWGLFLFLGAILCIDDLIQLMPSGEKMEGLTTVVLLLGTAKVINMSVGLNLNILGFSRFIKYTIFSIILLAITNVTLNFLFIPKWGMIGAAVSILISIIIFNCINALFFWLGFRIAPYKKGVLGVLILGLFSYLLVKVLCIQLTLHPAVNILTKGTFLAILYFGNVLWLNLSPELTIQVQKIWKRFF